MPLEERKRKEECIFRGLSALKSTILKRRRKETRRQIPSTFPSILLYWGRGMWFETNLSVPSFCFLYSFFGIQFLSLSWNTRVSSFLSWKKFRMSEFLRYAFDASINNRREIQTYEFC